MTRNEARVIHDQLLAVKPSDANHDETSCAFCAPSDVASKHKEGVNPMSEDNKVLYTQEQADALVGAAVTKAEKEHADALAAAVSALENDVTSLKDEVSSLQTKRDEDQIELAAARDRITSLEGDITHRDEEVAKLARRETRLAAVTEVAKFSDKYIEENVDRWVEMSDVDFASYLDAIREVAAQVVVEVPVPDTQVPDETAMQNERDEKVQVSARGALFSSLRGGNQ